MHGLRIFYFAGGDVIYPVLLLRTLWWETYFWKWYIKSKAEEKGNLFCCLRSCDNKFLSELKSIVDVKNKKP